MVVMMKKKLLCSRCKKNMSYKGKSIIGLSIDFASNEDWPGAFVKKQFGKYYGKENISLCYECFYDNLLGVK